MRDGGAGESCRWVGGPLTWSDELKPLIRTLQRDSSFVFEYRTIEPVSSLGSPAALPNSWIVVEH